MICSRCGNTVPDWTNICPKCGFIMPEDVNNGAPDTGRARPQSRNAELKYTGHQLNQKYLDRNRAEYVRKARARKSRNRVLIVLLSCLLAVLTAVVAFEALTLYQINRPQTFSTEQESSAADASDPPSEFTD